MTRPAIASNLMLVDQRAESVMRQHRIDALGVDHTRAGCGIPELMHPMLARCWEAEAREPEWEHIRAEATLSERMDAWRYFFGGAR